MRDELCTGRAEVDGYAGEVDRMFASDLGESETHGIVAESFTHVHKKI